MYEVDCERDVIQSGQLAGLGHKSEYFGQEPGDAHAQEQPDEDPVECRACSGIVLTANAVNDNLDTSDD